MRADKTRQSAEKDTPAPAVLIATDSFKGTFTALEVATAISRGVTASGLDSDICPVADGGEGTTTVLAEQREGTTMRSIVQDPLGRAITAEFAMLTSAPGEAVLDMAAASGLDHLEPSELDPWAASTYGTGQLICAAIDAGAQQVLVAAGGSATVDGGAGALEAIRDAGGLHGAQIIVLCDVRSTWEQCAEIYGPQKGATSRDTGRLARRLDEFAATLPRDPRGIPMSGAAGGLAGGLWAALDATLVPGASFVLDSIGFQDRLARAACVVTGEGSIDRQSAMGKIVGEIGARAKAAGVPVIAVVGRHELSRQAARSLGLEAIIEATDIAEMVAAGGEVARYARNRMLAAPAN
jgi:glycerate 2-kinase